MNDKVIHPTIPADVTLDLGREARLKRLDAFVAKLPELDREIIKTLDRLFEEHVSISWELHSKGWLPGYEKHWIVLTGDRGTVTCEAEDALSAIVRLAPSYFHMPLPK